MATIFCPGMLFMSRSVYRSPLSMITGTSIFRCALRKDISSRPACSWPVQFRPLYGTPLDVISNVSFVTPFFCCSKILTLMFLNSWLIRSTTILLWYWMKYPASLIAMVCRSASLLICRSLASAWSRSFGFLRVRPTWQGLFRSLGAECKSFHPVLAALFWPAVFPSFMSISAICWSISAWNFAFFELAYPRFQIRYRCFRCVSASDIRFSVS